MTLGEKLSYIRNKRCMTRETLSDLTGISKTSIYNYETNKRDITIDSLEKIAKSLRIPMSILFNSLDEDDLIFEDNINLYINQNIHIEKIVQEDLYGNSNTSYPEEFELEELYAKYFSKLLEWRVGKLDTNYEFFKLVLNWYSSLNPSLNLNIDSIEELSAIFSRLLSLESFEREYVSLYSNRYDTSPEKLNEYISSNRLCTKRPSSNTTSKED